MRFELHLLTGIKKFDTLAEVKAITKDLRQPYEVYKFIESNANKIIKERELFGENGVAGLVHEFTRGTPLSTLAKKYHTSTHTITKHINKFKSEYTSIK